MTPFGDMSPDQILRGVKVICPYCSEEATFVFLEETGSFCEICDGGSGYRCSKCNFIFDEIHDQTEFESINEKQKVT